MKKEKEKEEARRRKLLASRGGRAIWRAQSKEETRDTNTKKTGDASN
jgi:hypothetical protein